MHSIRDSINIVEAANTLELPSIDVGDTVLVGKWKNRKAEIKGFTADQHNQPVLKTNKGDQKLFKPRLTKLMDEADTVLTVYRGEYSGNRGGNFYTPDRGFARQFTQSGLDREIKVRFIRNSLIFRPTEPVYAGDPDAAVETAKAAGFKAVWLDEGPGQPDSIYVFDRTALRMTR